MTVIDLHHPRTDEFAEVGGLAVADASNEAPVWLGASPEIASVKWMTPPTATSIAAPEAPPAPSSHRPVRKDLLGLTRSERNGTVKFTFSSHARDETGENRLHLSMVALSDAASSTDPDVGDWLDAAVTLKRDAVRLRNSSHARHAAVLLTLADALTFTLPSDPTLGAGASKILQRGLAVLTNPFISQEAEENLVVELISLGWNLAPASEGKPLAD